MRCRCTRSAGRGRTSPAPTCRRAASACRRSATTSRWQRRSCPAAGLPSLERASWWMPPAPSARTVPGCLAGACLGLCCFALIIILKRTRACADPSRICVGLSRDPAWQGPGINSHAWSQASPITPFKLLLHQTIQGRQPGCSCQVDSTIFVTNATSNNSYQTSDIYARDLEAAVKSCSEGSPAASEGVRTATQGPRRGIERPAALPLRCLGRGQHQLQQRPPRGRLVGQPKLAPGRVASVQRGRSPPGHFHRN